MAVSGTRHMTLRAGITAIALFGAVIVAAAPAHLAHARIVTIPVPALTVYGHAEATAPADMATVQILIGLGDRQFGFSQDGSGHSGFETASASSDDEGSGGRRIRVATTPETVPFAGMIPVRLVKSGQQAANS